jgi:hypothetical protein
LDGISSSLGDDFFSLASVSQGGVDSSVLGSGMGTGGFFTLLS